VFYLVEVVRSLIFFVNGGVFSVSSLAVGVGVGETDVATGIETEVERGVRLPLGDGVTMNVRGVGFGVRGVGRGVRGVGFGVALAVSLVVVGDVVVGDAVVGDAVERAVLGGALFK